MCSKVVLQIARKTDLLMGGYRADKLMKSELCKTTILVNPGAAGQSVTNNLEDIFSGYYRCLSCTRISHLSLDAFFGTLLTRKKSTSLSIVLTDLLK